MSAADRALPAAVGLLGLVVLGLGRVPRPAGPVVLQPVAPPLTRIAALGDAPLAPEAGPPPGAPPPGGGPPGGPPGGGHPPPGPDPRAGHALRVAVEADAIAIAEVLGPLRVEAAVRQREALSAALAETAVWDETVRLLEAAP